MLNGHGPAVTRERELQASVRRPAAHPQALNAVLQQPLRCVGRRVSAMQVSDWGCLNLPDESTATPPRERPRTIGTRRPRPYQQCAPRS